MPITILDYVKSVVGDKDFYTAEDCLISGVDIIGGCQGCAATIAIYNAYPSTSGYWRCAGCIGDTDSPPSPSSLPTPHGDLPVLPEHRHDQRNPHHHQRTRRGIRTGMRRLRHGLAAMTTPALDWLPPGSTRSPALRRRLPVRTRPPQDVARPRTCPADDRVPVGDGRRSPDAGHPRRLRRSRPVAAMKPPPADYYTVLGRRT